MLANTQGRPYKTTTWKGLERVGTAATMCNVAGKPSEIGNGEGNMLQHVRDMCVLDL